MGFSEKLKLIRKERDITQEELAELLLVSRQAVSKWESGGGYPETEKLLQISKVLNVSLDYLLLDEDSIAEKKAEEPQTVVYVPSGKISIQAFDKKSVVVCHAVKTSRILFTGKDQPKYILNGIDRVTFWGENTTTLGWYESLESIEKEVSEISKTLAEGRTSYELQFNVDIEYVGLLGQPKIKPKS